MDINEGEEVKGSLERKMMMGYVCVEYTKEVKFITSKPN